MHESIMHSVCLAQDHTRRGGTDAGERHGAGGGARLAPGEGIKTIARELGVDRKTVKRWRLLGQGTTVDNSR
ncbi:MAG: hypothetical protein ABI988_02530 [Nitrospirota bacterium]